VIDIIYKQNFDNFLCALAYIYKNNSNFNLISLDNYAPSFITTSHNISTDLNTVKLFKEFILLNFGEEILESFYYLYIYDLNISPTLIPKYIYLLSKYGPAYYNNYSNPTICQIRKLIRKVTFEVHRFLGLIRFSQSNNFLYSFYEPDHKITTLLSSHFTDRLKNENFIIIDKKHKEALVYQNRNVSILLLDKIPTLNSLNNFYENLWKTYFENIAIPERKNLKLQNNFIPKRYKKHLIEFK